MVFKENPAPGEGPPTPPDPGDADADQEFGDGATPTSSAFRSLIETYRHARRSLLRRNHYKRVSDLMVSKTDPDAKPMRSTSSGSKLGYHSQYVVDGGRARVILATLMTSAAVMGHSPMLYLVHRLRFRWRLRPEQATCHNAYSSLECNK